MPTAAFTTLGCKVNQYETQRILESFEEGGFEVVPFDSAADVYVINSCSVTSIAESKSRYTIRRASRLNPDAKVVVTGCAAQMSDNNGGTMEGAGLVVSYPVKLETFKRFRQKFPDLGPSITNVSEGAVGLSLGRTRATLKVQDGCNAMCSYCSIPFTRPGMVSRHAEEVLSEAEKLRDLGYRELVLTGVLIGAYGPDSGSGGPDFEELVDMISDSVGPGVRIRISSIELGQVTNRLIDLVLGGKVVPHLHIPLQCGNDQVLMDMNRKYTQAAYTARCKEIQALVPGLSLSTDILVGFPTETEDRFESSAEVCREVGFVKVHVFRFSPRWGTPADRFGDPVSPQEKQRRSVVLSQIGAVTRQLHAEQFLGRTLRVLVEGKLTPEGLLEGLTDNYLDVRFAGPKSLQRQFAEVRIEEVREGYCYGELVTRPLAP